MVVPLMCSTAGSSVVARSCVGLDADAVLEGNELSDGPHLYLQDPGDLAVVRDNIITGTFDRAMGLFTASTMTIENNIIDNAGSDGITVGWVSAVGADPLIEGNEISGSATGIWIAGGAAPVISGNQIHGNGIGIACPIAQTRRSVRTPSATTSRTCRSPRASRLSGLDAGSTICEDAPAE